MGTISLKETRRRSGLDIVSDKDLNFYCPNGLGSVRKQQRLFEKLDPTHKIVRLCAIDYYIEKGLDIYRFGITVNGVGTCPDFAFFKRNKIVFVECLTEPWVIHKNILNKRKIEQYAPIVFFIEDKLLEDFSKPSNYRNYQNRIRSVAKSCEVWLCNTTTKHLKKFKP